MAAIPRITRAQSMDALSSQATVVRLQGRAARGGRARQVLPHAHDRGRARSAPAQVLVLGAGVAGLQAIATARRLGAVVSAYDVRPAVKEQVESLGASFLELDVEGAEGAGGYAVALSEDEHEREQELLALARRRVGRGDHDRADPGPARAAPPHRGRGAPRWRPAR